MVTSNLISPSNTSYCLKRKGGRSIVDRQPIFTPDGQFLLVIVNNVIRVHNISTGECVRVLETDSEVSQLVSACFPHDQQYNLHACSSNGIVTVWSSEGSVAKEVNLEVKDKIEVLEFNVVNSSECIVAGHIRKTIHMLKCCLKSGDILLEYKINNFPYTGILKVILGSATNDPYIAICNGSQTIMVQDVNNVLKQSSIVNYNKVRVLSLAAHPTEASFVFGDALGRAVILKGNLFGEPVREILHWHALPLPSCAFSSQGSYLYTGGLEMVLVKWTLGELATRAAERQFLPRLPGLVKYVATSSAHVALALKNNSIIIASTQLQLVTSILECGGVSQTARRLPTPLLYHRALGSLLLPGRPGHLQVFSATTDKVLYNVDITCLNAIPATRHKLNPEETEVTCAAVSPDGSWLVTSEYRNDGITYPEEKLKFWLSVTAEATPFQLNTCVSLSHGGCNVVSIALDSKADFCVTAGSDQKFRVWRKDVNTEAHKKHVVWGCLTTCYYATGVGAMLDHSSMNRLKDHNLPKDDRLDYPYLTQNDEDGDVVKLILGIDKGDLSFKDDVGSIRRREAVESGSDMGGVAISQDGSLVGAWFGRKLTLWDTRSCGVRAALSHPALRPRGRHVSFGYGDAAHLLACTSEDCLAVWSLLSLSVKWILNIRPTALAADPFSNKMAVVTDSNDVIVFTPHSSTPILSRQGLVNSEDGVFRSCVFGAASNDDIRLFMMRNDSEIYCLEPVASSEGAVDTLVRRNLPASNFSALVAEHRGSGVAAAARSEGAYLDSDALRSSALRQYLSAAPHMLPSLSLLCSSFLEHISGHKEVTEEDEPEALEVEEEQSSDDEDQPTARETRVELWAPNPQVKEKRLRKIVKESDLTMDFEALLI